MDFQRARTKEQVETRVEEIVQACKSIYEEQGYDAVNIKTVSEKISCTRPAIYKYFKTKEEIMMELLKREYLSWKEELEMLFSKKERLSKEEYCLYLTKSMSHRLLLMDLMSNHLDSIENGTRLERLIEFKKNVALFYEMFRQYLELFFPNTSLEKRKIFEKSFIVFLHGLYPSIKHSPKQIEAMLQAGMNYQEPDFMKICQNGLFLLASDLK